jgi:hypothetical protein
MQNENPDRTEGARMKLGKRLKKYSAKHDGFIKPLGTTNLFSFVVMKDGDEHVAVAEFRNGDESFDVQLNEAALLRLLQSVSQHNGSRQ